MPKVAKSLDPDRNRVELADGSFVGYGKVTSSFPPDPRVSSTSAWLLKTKFLPLMYWSLMLRGNEFDSKHRERQWAAAS